MNRSLAPLGSDRFYDLAQDGFFNQNALFRVVPGFILQFGISGFLSFFVSEGDTYYIYFCIFHPGNSSMNEKWLNNKIKDEPVIGSNTRGTISFATNGPDSRTSEVDEKKYNHKF